MQPRQRFAKIAITLPAEDLASADRLAAKQDRSRSWIIAEALRQYVVRASSPDQQVALDDSRHEQLRRDMALTPVKGIQAAEASVRLVGRSAAAPSENEPLFFEDFDAFLAWNRERAATPPDEHRTSPTSSCSKHSSACAATAEDR